MKLAKCVGLSGLRVKSAVHWVWLMRSINWIKREGNPLTEEGILLPTAFRLRIATSASLQFTRGQLVDLLVFLSQFLKTNHSLCLPAGSVCTSHGVFWRTVTHEHCKCSSWSPMFWGVLLVEDNSWFLTAPLEEHLLSRPSPSVFY